MPQIVTKKSDDEEDIVEDFEDEEEEDVAVPAVSDSRRRRQQKRGEVVAEVAAPAPTRKDRPTPSQHQEVVESKNPVVRFWRNFVEYLQEVRDELDKVAWLSREETIRLAYIVLIVTVISSAFLGTVGYIFALLTAALATANSTILAGSAVIATIIIVSGGWLFRDRLFGGHFD